MIPMRPYLLRAINEWLLDNNFTPFVLVNAHNENVVVPREYVKDGQITLNLSPSAIKALHIDNEWLSFHARFSGKSQEVFVPIPAVLAIFAKEDTQKGMLFPQEEIPESSPPEPTPPVRAKPVLRVVK
jgi:stringent starvation protein B